MPQIDLNSVVAGNRSPSTCLQETRVDSDFGNNSIPLFCAPLTTANLPETRKVQPPRGQQWTRPCVEYLHPNRSRSGWLLSGHSLSLRTQVYCHTDSLLPSLVLVE
ncbi:hypothetical protein DTO164E3_4769 [Paecilomyces variotii]|nr:hypothetical protein DTO032I3_5209 [Paecilomyces variotii]KAJ9199065.1 hypothetical protein DTO164E3_4769 [Paecilomyces variotii]KAJ9255533.1 hypothetical protein DTO207G8_2923 [Paecilomyces variotii]KAJ9274548.1 hypothetical protein DTO021D3_8565 [Paecilomyces variotii]KAJ9283844.1 hypothetical protein DTO021C3_8601 [Paecilomyces variotii]